MKEIDIPGSRRIFKLLRCHRCVVASSRCCRSVAVGCYSGGLSGESGNRCQSLVVVVVANMKEVQRVRRVESFSKRDIQHGHVSSELE